MAVDGSSMLGPFSSRDETKSKESRVDLVYVGQSAEATRAANLVLRFFQGIVRRDCFEESLAEQELLPQAAFKVQLKLVFEDNGGLA